MMKTKEYYLNNLKILFEDNHIIVIEKPIDVLSQKDETNDFDITEIINDYLRIKYNKPGKAYVGLVHRLDRRVGGVMVLAKSSKAASRLSDDIRTHSINKQYAVKVEGKLDKSSSINVKIKKDENKRLAIICDDGKEAELDYKVIGYDNNDTYALVNLITGRYNQIRASFSYINHPVIGDTKYGGHHNNELGLWCYKLDFIHPVTKEWMEFIDRPNGEIWNNLKL